MSPKPRSRSRAGAGRTGSRGGSSRSGKGPATERFHRVAQNRRARHDYDLLETFECGIALQGGEVKSLRAGKAALRDAYARVEDGEVWLVGAYVAPYEYAKGFGSHDPDRPRKLLLHRRQIDELVGKTKQQSLTLVPLSIYFRDGRAKVEIALASGRRTYDKRRAIAARDAEREAARAAVRDRRGE